MNDSSNKKSVIVGMFIVVGIVFLLGGILIIGNLRETFVRKMSIISLFEDVNGLQPGNNVWFSGVKIGTVNTLNFFGKSQVKVSMNISTKSKQYIRKDAKVKISNDGLIGNKILIIYGGTEKSEAVEEGDTLLVEKTFSSDDMINTLQENNKNLLAITSDIRSISHKLAAGEGTIGKLLKDSSIFSNIHAATVSLQTASVKAEEMVGSLAQFSLGLNRKGTLGNELSTDTMVYGAVKASVLKFQQIADTATLFIANLKQAASNPRTPVGILIHDEESGRKIKETIKNLESSSIKLNEDLEAAQHNFLLRGFFKNRTKVADPAQK